MHSTQTDIYQRTLQSLITSLSLSNATACVLRENLERIDLRSNRSQWSFHLLDGQVEPLGINYNSTITPRFEGDHSGDRFQVWHFSGGTYRSGYGCRSRFGSTIRLIEIMRQPTNGRYGKYREVAEFRAGTRWHVVLEAVTMLCRLLNTNDVASDQTMEVVP